MSHSSSGRLEGQVAIVTGGASGIGHATCRALAREGAHVVVVDVNEEKIAALLAELSDGAPGDGRHLGLALDVSSEADMTVMAEQASQKYGRIDILVACAGILRGRGTAPKPLVDITTDEWDQVISINLKGMFLSNRAVLPTMIQQRRGNILNISSVSGREGRAYDAPYCASKFGVIGMTESLAQEVRSAGVRVQMVLPDATATPIWEQNKPVPMPTEAIPAERVADLIIFMLTQPDDAILIAPIIAPFRSRRRVIGKKAQEQAGTVS
jgi:NAD(P)-dependent dehydrogenase (short-subunit alcohol dehydrogenase family)